MIKRIKNEGGLTLVELLLSLSIMLIISAVAYFVFLNGLNSYKKTYTETLIRDEADVIMTQFMNVVYPAKDALLSTDKNNVIILDKGKKTEQKFGFDGSNAVLNSTALNNSDFDLSGSVLELDTTANTIKIKMKIKSTKSDKAKPLALNSQISLLGGGGN
ncbi:prepilin-type N-terminal cleavage/methylation domain-containing protein [Fictibacillus sp. KIGAM418]|uniref:Prepilin-type N-terminal cleavage/methylation domain-containing protein n=1 Tax=Fictibacillus marinisediminis TaxID=2878389 RepID=A0A9X1XDP8_9BACL|nr:prepilin-type N-terminal cleavage/methylation domain-containing protein [Fictibacillus marinisediminis]MCK6257930.1 prepilin-type N-terminal cleavage/methylation domain-containing protein [Fictibacillus marinisediminis]